MSLLDQAVETIQSRGPERKKDRAMTDRKQNIEAAVANFGG